MFDIAQYKLTDLLSSAGATIGIIIAGVIFLQFMSTRLVDLSGKYRELTREYRSRGDAEARHAPLRSQIRMYRRRLELVNRAAGLGAAAVLCFLLAVTAGGLSMAYPTVLTFKWVGTFGLLAGLAGIAGGVALHLIETIHARHEIAEEIADLDGDTRS